MPVVPAQPEQQAWDAMADRKFSVWLSDDAYEGWDEAAHTHRCNMTQLAEVIGLALRELHGVPAEKIPKTWRVILREAARRAVEKNKNRGRRRV